MIVPFYVEMKFDEETRKHISSIMDHIQKIDHLAVYQGEPIFGGDLFDIEAKDQNK